MTNKIMHSIEVKIGVESSKALKVVVMGQTGVGKSTLLNALFKINLKTDPVRPCTMKVEPITITNDDGHELTFYDMPGIGESQSADKNYIQQYTKYLLDTDVAIWALHADIRSLTFDSNSLSQIFSQMTTQERSRVISKIVFVLTKVDLLASPAWMLGKIGSQAMFVPVEETQRLMDAKAEYTYEQLVNPYKDLMVSTTYLDVKQKFNEPRFVWDEHLVHYKGAMTQSDVKYLTQKYPTHSELFTRLYHNYQVIPCSSRFRYNLHELFLMIVNRLGDEAIYRFQNFFKNESLNHLSYKSALNFSNIFVYDREKNKIIYDLSNTN